MILYIILTLLAILLIINIILTFKTGKKESDVEFNEIKSAIGSLT